jgi:hypothetical protein
VYLKVANSSEGTNSIITFLLRFVSCCLSHFLPSAFAAALATANARIALLEAELKASQKAYDAATSAKTIAEKSQKSALAKAKKAERALTDANKEHAQREQAVAERLHTMSTAAESKFFDLSSVFVPSCAGVFLDTYLFCSFLLL